MKIDEKSIFVFRNMKKKPGTNQPDYKVSCCVNGVQYEAGLWMRSGTKGDYLLGKLAEPKPYEPPQNKTPNPNYEQKPQKSLENEGDVSLPF